MDPLVSIVITYYNQHDFIREAVTSAQRQTYQNIEVIVVDDGSSISADRPLEGLNRIQILRKENGCPAARNFGFHHTSGDYIVFLDGDDRLLPRAVDAHLKALRIQPDAGLVFGATQLINEKGDLIRKAHVCRPRRDYFLMLLESNPVECPGAALFSRNGFIRAGQFDVRFPPVEIT
jgi:glycosyltransferase involved in cell wall biosynthesis